MNMKHVVVPRVTKIHLETVCCKGPPPPQVIQLSKSLYLGTL
jgi:hypothetical protein